MRDLTQLLDLPPYSLCKEEKAAMMNEMMCDLTLHHMKNCDSYRKMLSAEGVEPNNIPYYTELPFLPVRLFKEFDLRSVSEDQIVKTMTSSGTTGQAVSKIFLDRETSALQTKVLAKIVSDFIGKQRIPMLILDSSEVVKNRTMFSARGAGILGFSMFGAKHFYALDANMRLDVDGVVDFLKTYKDSPIFLFGFTFMIWEHFYKQLKEQNVYLDLANGILIHGGGWKKLISEKVSSSEFKERLNDVCGINRVFDYYGMVEQTGSIYMECEKGHLHASIFSDVIIRRAIDFSIADIGETGIVQVISLLPYSYPGHSLLTEDLGVLLGEDDCACGRKGKYFKVIGRMQNAEIRGCSDTYTVKK